MINFKALAATTLLAATTIFGGAAVQAETCGRLGYGTFCNEYEGYSRQGQIYTVGYVNGAEREGFNIICDGRNLVRWESKGNLSQGQAQWVAEEFCALPN